MCARGFNDVGFTPPQIALATFAGMRDVHDTVIL